MQKITRYKLSQESVQYLYLAPSAMFLAITTFEEQPFLHVIMDEHESLQSWEFRVCVQGQQETDLTEYEFIGIYPYLNWNFYLFAKMLS